MYVDPKQIAQADNDRSALQFVNFMSGLVNGEQSVAHEDAMSMNTPGQYQTVTPYGVSVEGRPVSNLQGATLALPPIPLSLLLMLAAGAFFLLKK